MGFFDIFRKSVKKTKQSLSLELDSFSGKITFDTLEELEEILILADVGVTTAGKICSRLGERIKRRNIDSTELRENLCEIVTELMEPDEPLVTETKPSVVLVVGVNGVGKTTSIGKLAYWLQGQGKKVLLGAADTFRAAAGEQLGVWAERVGCQMIKHAEGADPVVSLEDVCFAYPGGTASVDHLDMRVYPGEVVGIVGQNGAGKTTLTKLLNGLLRPASGTVRMAGLDTHEVPTSAIAAHCATLFQNPDYQLCKDTVLEEVAFGLTLQGVDEKEARERASAVIEHFGLPADEAPFSLSRGQRQMVALASVVVMEPEVVLLDEPTSGLDYRECMTVMDTVSKMAERGCAVIMVCHDMEVVSDFAERIVVMANGRILDRGGTLEMFSNAKLMQEASVRAPQVIELSEVLARDLSPEFAGISQVSGIVDLTKEMVRRG